MTMVSKLRADNVQHGKHAFIDLITIQIDRKSSSIYHGLTQINSPYLFELYEANILRKVLAVF